MDVVKPFGRGRDPELVALSLCDENPDVAEALARHFEDAPGVEVLRGDLFALDGDALVSPANSFGDMGGGVDRRIDLFYREAAQRAVMARIADRFHGELPVVSATIVPMNTRRFPFLVVAPTVRVPGPVAGTINAYLAFRAALAAVADHNRDGGPRIARVASPGFGTGVGGMSPGESALQMRAAYDMIVLGAWRRVVHPIQAPFAASY